MTLQRAGGAAALSDTAADYAATMAPALRPVATEVVRRAELRPRERVVDIGTGTGTAAGMAVGEGRHVIGVDAAPGMLGIARREVPHVEFVEADFASLPLADGAVDVVLAAHALLFADDRVGVLREWRRTTRRGGRISLSVPGPSTRVPTAIFGSVYERYGIVWGDDYPEAGDVARWASDAGWSEIETAADPSAAIPLADESAFRTWLRVGARGRATRDWSGVRREQFIRDLMAAAPRDPDDGFRIPFGALFLRAVNPG